MIRNLTRDTSIAVRSEVTQTAWQRMKGLLGREGLGAGDALVITHCQSIHMLFMKFPIDVIFCDGRDRVVGLCPHIQPYMFSQFIFKLPTLWSSPPAALPLRRPGSATRSNFSPAVFPMLTCLNPVI